MNIRLLPARSNDPVSYNVALTEALKRQNFLRQNCIVNFEFDVIRTIGTFFFACFELHFQENPNFSLRPKNIHFDLVNMF